MLPAMERESIIRQSLLQRGAVILCSDKREALELANRVAPEHLELAVAEPQEWIDEIRHAGAIFCGAHTGETFGDYVAGPSHVLLTFGTARFASPLGVYDFQKRTSVVEMSARGASELSAVTDILAQSEGLFAHAQAAAARAVALTIVRLLPTAQARLVSDSAAQLDADSPLQRYQRLLADTAAVGGTFHADLGQEQVVQRLDELFQRLMRQPKQSLWQKWITRSAPPPVEGLYIWGTVGRGKTLLMDMFFDCLPAGQAQRMHFHRFMRHVHLGLKTYGGVADPLQRVADEFSHPRPRSYVLTNFLYQI